VIGRVVEVASDGRHLSAYRGFMVVEERGAEVGRVALDDIAVLIANAHGLSYTTNLMLALARRGVSVIFCDASHRPAAWLWPIDGHHAQAGRMRAQVAMSRPTAKRVWKRLVTAKIERQAMTLAAVGRPDPGLHLLAKRVRSGDPHNVESQAARRYWPRLLGSSFRRSAGGEPPNGLLNYGYAVLRAATARAVACAGLHPSIGVHHKNPANAFCLVDDLMEPFRPVVDLLVARLVEAGSSDVEPESKRFLAQVTALDLATALGRTPLQTCLDRLAGSLAAISEGRVRDLDLPGDLMPPD
jgi:CRISP-associated protein Cas1